MIALNEVVTEKSALTILQRHVVPRGIEIFNHHLYEYKKGLRDLILQTCSHDLGYYIIPKLDRCGVDYIVYPLGKKRINLFFGDAACLEIVRTIGKFELSRYTPEEDFILGIMLGYGRHKQCERYLRLKYNTNKNSQKSKSKENKMERAAE
jgi:hypothetical protein